MSGSKWTQAQRATQLFLKSLPKGSQFNVVGFGSSRENVFSSPEPYNNSSMAHASKVISGWSANLGGTEMAGPLEEIVSKKASQRVVVILTTDGQDSTTDRVLKLSKQHIIELYTLGIGGDVNASFLQSISENSGSFLFSHFLKFSLRDHQPLQINN